MGVLEFHEGFDGGWTPPQRWDGDSGSPSTGGGRYGGIDSAYGTQHTVTSAALATANQLIFASITFTGPSSVSNQMFLDLARVIGSGSDTFSGDARLLYVIVSFRRYINN